MAPPLRTRIQVFIAISAALAIYSVLFQIIFPTRNDEGEVEVESPFPTIPETYNQTYLEQLQLPTSYQCALVWLRLPKTASTTVIRRFVSPLTSSARLQIAELGPNTCISHVGGCREFWQGWETRPAQGAGIDEQSLAPPYGISSYDDQNDRSEGNNQRCFPDAIAKARLYCWEYDRANSTIFYGPHPYTKPKKRKINANNTFTTAKFNLYPSLHAHVAIDTSIFGWILPQRPMVFSTFRDPIERLFSSFHYGIQYGGGRPGEVRRCKLPGVKDLDDWQSRVILAREAAALKNLTLYQQALREYLDYCMNAVDNAYVQFLDPKSKDVARALDHLNRYVIVGLQNDLEESFQRWAKIALWTCRDHPRLTMIERALSDPTKLDSHYRDSTSLANGTGNELASPTLDELDLDLQQLIKKFTAGDQVIFDRAEDLFAEQGRWFEMKDSTNEVTIE